MLPYLPERDNRVRDKRCVPDAVGAVEAGAGKGPEHNRHKPLPLEIQCQPWARQLRFLHRRWLSALLAPLKDW